MDSDREELMMDARLKVQSNDTPVTLLGECPVCLRPANGMHGLPCGHIFCIDCWVQYILSKISAGVATCKID